jgi:hypothetical protein
MKRAAVLCVLIAAFVVSAAAQTKYGVTVTADKATDFKTIRSYVWEAGWETPNRTVHAQIVAAVDRELKALGLEKKASGPSDVIVKYASLRRVDTSANPRAELGSSAQQEVGTLQVVMLQPGTAKELLRLRIDKPIEVDAAKIEAQVNEIVTELFAKYPTRVKK